MQTIVVSAMSLTGVRRGSTQIVQQMIGGERCFGRQLGHFQCLQDLLLFRVQHMMLVETEQDMMRCFTERSLIKMLFDLLQDRRDCIMVQFDECIGSDPADIHVIVRQQRSEFTRGARIADLLKCFTRFPADVT